MQITSIAQIAGRINSTGQLIREDDHARDITTLEGEDAAAYLFNAIQFASPIYHIDIFNDDDPDLHHIILLNKTPIDGGFYYEKIEYKYKGDEDFIDLKTIVLKYSYIEDIDKELANIKKKYPVKTDIAHSTGSIRIRQFIIKENNTSNY